MPEAEWEWEVTVQPRSLLYCTVQECSVAVCEVDCARPGLPAPPGLPPCPQYTEQNPELQAAVSALSGGGVSLE